MDGTKENYTARVESINSKKTKDSKDKEAMEKEIEYLDEIIKNYDRVSKEVKESNLNELALNGEKSEDFLNFFFQDPDIKTIYFNYPRVKNILTLQSIYYFSILQKIINKLKNSNKIELSQEDVKQETKVQVIIDEDQNKQKSSNNDNVFLNSYCIKTKFINPTTKTNITPFPILPNISTGHNTETQPMPLPKPKSQTQSYKYLSPLKSEKSNPLLKVGIVGCGVMGSNLLKILIKIKDINLQTTPFKIMVSTRSPQNIDNEIRTAVDDFVEIFMNNEKV